MQEKPYSIFHQLRKKKSKFKGLLIKVERYTIEECRGCAKQRKLGVFGGQALNKAGSHKEGINAREKLKIKRPKKSGQARKENKV